MVIVSIIRLKRIHLTGFSPGGDVTIPLSHLLIDYLLGNYENNNCIICDEFTFVCLIRR